MIDHLHQRRRDYPADALRRKEVSIKKSTTSISQWSPERHRAQSQALLNPPSQPGCSDLQQPDLTYKPRFIKLVMSQAKLTEFL